MSILNKLKLGKGSKGEPTDALNREQDNENMAGMFKNVSLPWGHGKEEQTQEGQEGEGESLTTILKSEDDRSALTLLIADCTEAMRQSIVDIFDAKQLSRKQDVVPDEAVDDALKEVEKMQVSGSESSEEEEKRMKKKAEEKQKAAEDKEKRLKKELEAREKELSTEKFLELKKAALKHFDEWRASVIQRVGEVVNSREQAKKQQDEATTGGHHTGGDSTETEKKKAPPMNFSEPPEYDSGVDQANQRVYPPIENPIKDLPDDKKALILHSVLLLLLSLEHYQAYSRVLMQRLTTSLQLSISFLAHDESKVARALLSAAENMQADDETKKRAEENKGSRKWKVGLASVAGAALIGVTGGLAAPLLAAGIGTVMGGLGLGATAAAGYLGTLAGSSVLVGGLFGAYGASMTGKMMDQYAREVSDFAFLPIRSHHKPRKIEKEYRRLRVGIGISGWLSNQDEVVEPWKVIGSEMEGFALRWELEALMNLGNSLTSMITSAAWGVAKQQIIQHTVFAALTAGLWPLALLKVSRVIDNPWSVGSYRAQKAGEVLADALINKAQGERPVTLIGYSLGAKVIFTCLQHLAERKAFGLVENVVLMGTPAPSTGAEWRLARTAVSGRVVNVYSTKDYILAFLHRSSSMKYGVAGLQAVEDVAGVENFDVSETVEGHTRYRYLTGPIMRRIGFEDVDDAELSKEIKALKEQEAEEARKREEAEAQEGSTSPSAAKGDGKEGKDAEGKDISDEDLKKLEKEVEAKNQQSYVSWMQSKLQATGTSAGTAYEKAKASWGAKKEGKEVEGAAEGAGDPGKEKGGETFQELEARTQARKAEKQAAAGGGTFQESEANRQAAKEEKSSAPV